MVRILEVQLGSCIQIPNVIFHKKSKDIFIGFLAFIVTGRAGRYGDDTYHDTY